jgi:hypothetical protein
MLLADPRVLQAVVIGDGRAALGAVVVPAPGVEPAAVSAVVERVNAALPDYARLAHHLLSEPFTTANGMATGNGRPRRRQVLAFHTAALAALHLGEVAHDAVL